MCDFNVMGGLLGGGLIVRLFVCMCVCGWLMDWFVSDCVDCVVKVLMCGFVRSEYCGFCLCVVFFFVGEGEDVRGGCDVMCVVKVL